MKTEPMDHQKLGRKLLRDNPEYYALGAEQGTGKTWMLLDDAERQFETGMIAGLLVIAPKGVHTNWIIREIPTHLSVPVVAEFWLSGAGKRHMSRLEKLLRTDREDGLAVLAMNVDAINTKKGYEFATKFLRTFKSMIVVDESQRIKNPQAKRTKKVWSLAPFSVSRRIASGTLVANSPMDLFGQYQFLNGGLLGTTSFRAFVAEFSELLPAHHPMVQEIASKSRGVPQIVKRDREGRPMYRNLDKLSKLIAPYTFRVLKKDCLDLPEKIYQTHVFELTPSQRRLYDSVKEEMRYERDDGDVDIFTALTLINKLRQVTSGFIIVDGEATELREAKPRMDALKSLVEDTEGQIIIWASFREELRQIGELLSDYEVVQYHGGTKTKDREQAVDDFQNGRARIFLANPAAAGTGLTLTAANTAIYYSCSYNFEERSQSEDRCHRIGTKKPVLYIDLMARNTIDERIANALQTKAETAFQILDGI